VISLVSTNGHLVMKDVPFSGAPMLVRLKKKSPRIANRKLGPDGTFRKRRLRDAFQKTLLRR
jgi:hypothetical protein